MPCGIIVERSVEDAGRVTHADFVTVDGSVAVSPRRFWKRDTKWINNCFVLDISVRFSINRPRLVERGTQV